MTYHHRDRSTHRGGENARLAADMALMPLY